MRFVCAYCRTFVSDEKVIIDTKTEASALGVAAVIEFYHEECWKKKFKMGEKGKNFYAR